MEKYYAGIGSRGTPENILTIMEMLGKHFARNKWVLRSGAATGADTAFEKGAVAEIGRKEIYLPWRGYNNNQSQLHPANYPFTDEEMEFSAKFHPNWKNLTASVKKLHARNTRILLGMEQLHGHQVTPVKFCICWTPNGHITGGTGQALRIIESLNDTILCFNLGSADTPAQLEKMVQNIGEYGERT
jgi:hypothetical protein